MSPSLHRYFQLTLFCGHHTRCLATIAVPQVDSPAYCRACQRWVAIVHVAELHSPSSLLR